jgi:hypothetical protein
MLHRAMEAVLLSLGVAGLISLLVAVSPKGSREPLGSALTLERAAYAQTPEAVLRYHVVAERSEARYRVREQLAGISFPSDAVGTTRAIEGNSALMARAIYAATIPA